MLYFKTNNIINIEKTYKKLIAKIVNVDVQQQKIEKMTKNIVKIIRSYIIRRSNTLLFRDRKFKFKIEKYIVDFSIDILSNYQIDIQTMRTNIFARLKTFFIATRNIILDIFIKTSYQLKVCSTFFFFNSIN